MESMLHVDTYVCMHETSELSLIVQAAVMARTIFAKRGGG